MCSLLLTVTFLISHSDLILVQMPIHRWFTYAEDPLYSRTPCIEIFNDTQVITTAAFLVRTYAMEQS